MTQPRPSFPGIEDEGDQIPSFSMDDMPTTTTRSTTEDEVTELTWHHGEPVMVHQRLSRRSLSDAGSSHAVIPTNLPEHATEILPSSEQHMFIQEDEMATWLQHNLDNSFDRNLFVELIYSAPPLPPPITVAPAPPPISVISPPRYDMLPNFPHLTRLGIGPRFEPTLVEPVLTSLERPVTIVESNETPDVGQSWQTTWFEKMVTGTGEGTMGSSAGESVVLPPENLPGAAGEGKGKAKESDDSQSEENGSDSEAVEAKKKGKGSVSRKRQRVAEVHNLSERKRRDRINEKIRTLQKLVPGCNKIDKASILDDTIEYLKSMQQLQQQLQMIYMGCGMIPNPMMFPGVQQYVPAMGMGMAQMGMDLNRPILPYPTVLPTSAHHSQADTSEPRYSAQALNPSRIQASEQTELMLRLLAGQIPSMQQPMPNFLNPYQQHFLALQQQAAQVSSAQIQGPEQPSCNKPGSSKDPSNPEYRQTGP